MKLLKLLFKQRDMGVFMGTIKIIAGNITPYASWVSLALVGVMSFYTTISPVLMEWGFRLEFWMFCLILVLVVVLMAIFEWMLMMPSYYKANNSQAWQAGGGIVDEFKAMQVEFKAMKKELTEVKEMLKKYEPKN